jgi:polysaccharide deacetylase family protein (PEP-CTERM system associated)
MRLLGLLAKHNSQATFFVLGEVAERFPQLVKDIAMAGHEIGVHGYRHSRVFELTPDAFRQEVSAARRLLQDISGQMVRGHRAPAFSITPDTAWALDVLVEAGFSYDSSIVPFKGRRYGWPDYPLGIHRHELGNGRGLIEAPLAVIKTMGISLPVGGGGYMRHFPYALNHWALSRITQNRPFIAYMHPYEIEADSEGYPETHRRLLAGRARNWHRLQLRNRATVYRKYDQLLGNWTVTRLWDLICRVLPPPLNDREL